MKIINLIADDYEHFVELERRYLENNSYQAIIGHLMESHKTDPSFLKSPIWQSYMLEFQENLYFYEMEKNSFSQYVLNKLKTEYGLSDESLSDVSWEIVDFSFKEVKVTYKD